MADQPNLVEDAKLKLLETKNLSVTGLASGVANVKIFTVTVPTPDAQAIVTLTTSDIRTALELLPHQQMFLIDVSVLQPVPNYKWICSFDKFDQSVNLKLQDPSSAATQPRNNTITEPTVSVNVSCVFMVDMMHMGIVPINQMTYDSTTKWSLT